MQNIEVKNNQSVADVATEHNGSAEKALELALLNDLSLTEDLQPGHVLLKSSQGSSEVVNFFIREMKSPATKASEDLQTGIDFMKIGIDFTIK